MLTATIVAVLGAWAWSRGLAGDGAGSDIVMALVIGSVVTFAPTLLRVSPEYWGMAVLFAGITRALVIMGTCYLMTQNNSALAPRAIFLPAAGASLFLLAVETITAVRILSIMERQKAPAPNTH